MDKTNKQRYHLLDTLRAICIIYMVLYHTLYDLCELFYIDLPFFYAEWFGIVRYCFSGTFMLIAGVSCHLSQNNFKRGIKVFACAMVLTIVTGVIMPGQLIVFGILHFMGVMMLIYAVGQNLFSKMESPLWILLFLFFFVMTCHISNGYLGVAPFKVVLPQWVYTKGWLFPFGITVPGFVSSDYYPLLPWAFIFFTGVVLGKLLVNHKLPKVLYNIKENLLSKIGRYSLQIYMCHQVVIFVVLQLVFMVVKV